ncbi:hypothetical protein SEA_ROSAASANTEWAA_48 [Streptomyces phage RosaAsantewaa]|nr:hypothetical protein SEA_ROSAASANTEWAA_48 [Streptomyces phage RosaAsantewaa]
MRRRGRFWGYSDGILPEHTSRGENYIVDTVLNEFMRPVFPGEPDEVKRRLRHGYDDAWKYVLVGETKQVVTILEYLYADKYKDVTRLVKELLRKKDLPLYKRDPSILEQHIERTVKRIIERALAE